MVLSHAQKAQAKLNHHSCNHFSETKYLYLLVTAHVVQKASTESGNTPLAS